LGVDLKSAPVGHPGLEGQLATMTQRRAAKKAGEGDDLDQVGIGQHGPPRGIGGMQGIQGPQQTPRQLRHFQRLRQSRAHQVALIEPRQHVLALQAPEARAVQQSGATMWFS
jgi:hypothetical protein